MFQLEPVARLDGQSPAHLPAWPLPALGSHLVASSSRLQGTSHSMGQASGALSSKGPFFPGPWYMSRCGTRGGDARACGCCSGPLGATGDRGAGLHPAVLSLCSYAATQAGGWKGRAVPSPSEAEVKMESNQLAGPSLSLRMATFLLRPHTVVPARGLVT